jgi:hypothetical protein
MKPGKGLDLNLLAAVFQRSEDPCGEMNSLDYGLLANPGAFCGVGERNTVE